MTDLPSTPRCFEWAQTVKDQMELLETFLEWWQGDAEPYEDGGYRLPGRMDFERFLTQAYGFDFEELERERRALLDYQRSLNE